MPSTVKVRIKSARNLVASASPSRGRHGGPGVPLGGGHRPPAPRPGPGGPIVLPLGGLPDTAVTVTLGGHESISEYDDDELDDMAPGAPSAGGGGGGDHEGDGRHHRGTGAGTVTSRCYSARTRTVRRSIHPAFGEEFRFDVADDTLLQDEPLLFRVWEVGESPSAGQSSVGCVYIDLNPLLMRTANLEKAEGETGPAGAATTPDAKAPSTGGGRDRTRSGSLGNEAEAVPPSLSSTPTPSMRDSFVTPGAHGGLEVDGWLREGLGLSIKLNFIG